MIGPIFLDPNLTNPKNKQLVVKKNSSNKNEGVLYGPVNYLDKVVDFSDLEKDFYNKYYNEYTSGYQAYTPVKRDISQLLAAYEQEADTARQTALNTYNTTISDLESDYKLKKADYERSYNTQREDLLKSLKRYQEQFAEDSKAQRQAFLTNQAALEATREAANRSVRNSMAARGLGGSGLQQLALLQNVLGQSSEVSKLANQNQNTMNNLKRLLDQQQEDYDTDMARLSETNNANIQKLNEILSNSKTKALTNYNDLLNTITSGLTTNKANAINARDAEYANAVNDARRMASQYYNEAQQNASSRSEQAITAYDRTTDSLTAMLKDLSKTTDATALKRYADNFGITDGKGEAYTAKKIKKMDGNEKRELRQLIANVLVENVDATLTDYAITYNAPSSFNKTSANNINYILQTYGFDPYYVTK